MAEKTERESLSSKLNGFNVTSRKIRKPLKMAKFRSNNKKRVVISVKTKNLTPKPGEEGEGVYDPVWSPYVCAEDNWGYKGPLRSCSIMKFPDLCRVNARWIQRRVDAKPGQ